jgi:hypothetical protein
VSEQNVRAEMLPVANTTSDNQNVGAEWILVTNKNV